MKPGGVRLMERVHRREDSLFDGVALGLVVGVCLVVMFVAWCSGCAHVPHSPCVVDAGANQDGGQLGPDVVSDGFHVGYDVPDAECANDVDVGRLLERDGRAVAICLRDDANRRFVWAHL